MTNPQFRLLLGIFLTAGVFQCNAFVPAQCGLPLRALEASHSKGYSQALAPSLCRKRLTIINNNDQRCLYSRISSQRQLSLASLQEPVTRYVASLFRSTGGVPFAQAFSINALGISLLLKPLSKMLTGEGIIHALILGTSLWKTLGWRGWSVCVAYLLAGSLVTKVGFQKKDKLGIAEGRGGKRGPENLWYVDVLREGETALAQFVSILEDF